MSNKRIFVDRFDTTMDLPKRCSYATLKARVLEAGRFSCFDAGERPGDFVQLRRDSELVCTDRGYPWTGVRRREVKGHSTSVE